MFELSFEPKLNSKPVNDSIRIINAAINSKDKTMKKLALQCKEGELVLHITKRFVDARKGKVKIVYRFEFLTFEEYEELNDEIEKKAYPYFEDISNIKNKINRPIVVGFGPAGMFAGYILAKCGLKPIIIERGSEMDKRISDIEKVRLGIEKVNPESNIQFGEGGAGTFSDGKLYTGVSSVLKDYINNLFVVHGASNEIKYDSHPHIGTDRLRQVVVGIRKDIELLGGEVWFDTRFVGYKKENGKLKSITIENNNDSREIKCDKLILAIGHSSRDTIRALYKIGTDMESKPFSVGVRIEHLRSDIDRAQYGFNTAETSDLSSANYKLAVDTKTGKKLYTFCMCPGGEVIAAQSSPNSICTNGMSYFARDLDNSNSALLVPVDKNDFGSEVLDGIIFQEKLERNAFIAAGGTGKAPATRYDDLLNNRITDSFTKVIPSSKPGVVPADFRLIFPDDILETIKDGIKVMGTKINGFDDPNSVLTAVEARSSSPVRIVRDRLSCESTNCKGLFPCGEGAGYAGGIMSSAIDGINCANALIKSILDEIKY